MLFLFICANGGVPWRCSIPILRFSPVSLAACTTDLSPKVGASLKRKRCIQIGFHQNLTETLSGYSVSVSGWLPFLEGFWCHNTWKDMSVVRATGLRIPASTFFDHSLMRTWCIGDLPSQSPSLRQINRNPSRRPDVTPKHFGIRCDRRDNLVCKQTETFRCPFFTRRGKPLRIFQNDAQ